MPAAHCFLNAVGSEAGSYFRLIDFVYHSTLGLRVMKKKKCRWVLTAAHCFLNADSDVVFFFFFTLVAGPRRSLSLKLNDTRVYEPQIRARLGTTAGG